MFLLGVLRSESTKYRTAKHQWLLEKKLLWVFLLFFSSDNLPPPIQSYCTFLTSDVELFSRSIGFPLCSSCSFSSAYPSSCSSMLPCPDVQMPVQVPVVLEQEDTTQLSAWFSRRYLSLSHVQLTLCPITIGAADGSEILRVHSLVSLAGLTVDDLAVSSSASLLSPLY